MTITYRTAGAWGSGKGSNLTAAEVDQNFADLDGRVDALETTPPVPAQISDITQTGDQITIHLDNGDSFGPFTLPRSVQRPTVTVAVTASTLTPTADQASRYFRVNHATGCTVTIPANADQAFLVDTEIHFRQTGAGALTFVAGSGVTINIAADQSLATDTVGAVVTFKKIATNEWDAFGRLAGA